MIIGGVRLIGLIGGRLIGVGDCILLSIFLSLKVNPHPLTHHEHGTITHVTLPSQWAASIGEQVLIWRREKSTDSLAAVANAVTCHVAKFAAGKNDEIRITGNECNSYIRPRLESRTDQFSWPARPRIQWSSLDRQVKNFQCLSDKIANLVAKSGNVNTWPTIQLTANYYFDVWRPNTKVSIFGGQIWKFPIFGGQKIWTTSRLVAVVNLGSKIPEQINFAVYCRKVRFYRVYRKTINLSFQDFLWNVPASRDTQPVLHPHDVQRLPQRGLPRMSRRWTRALLFRDGDWWRQIIYDVQGRFSIECSKPKPNHNRKQHKEPIRTPSKYM